MKPIIGMTACRGEGAVYKTNDTYVKAVIRAGGVPVLLPIADLPEDCPRLVETFDALLVPGGVDIYTWQDVPSTRFAIAGQTYPEPSPYDRLIIDRHVRFVGDVVAIIAAETEKAADKAMKLIKTDYEVLEPVLDFRTAKDNPILVHPEEDW